MTPPDAQDVRAMLNTIIDPCSRAAGSPAGLDDMGLIRRVEIEPGPPPSVRVTLGLTEYGCLMGSPFVADAYRLLEPHFGVGQVDVELDGRYEWSPEHMSASYQERLSAAHREGRARLDPRAQAFPLLTITPPTRQRPQSQAEQS